MTWDEVAQEALFTLATPETEGELEAKLAASCGPHAILRPPNPDTGGTMPVRTLLATLALAAGGCATTFYGSPEIKGGRAQCEQVCAAWKMELAGMVQMGDYSNGCICQVPGKIIAPQALATAGKAIAGVWVQTQAAQAAAAANHKP